jgi:hypothetical protein
MQYTDDEIKAKYNHADNKKEMIQILADLNACDSKTIECIVGVKKLVKTSSKCATDTNKMNLSIVNNKIKDYCKESIFEVTLEIEKLEKEIEELNEHVSYQKELLKQWEEKEKEF